MAVKIITSHIFPPIPDRQFDWRAYYDGDDELPHMHGYGATQEEAIDDLKRLMWELADEEDEENDPDPNANFPFSGSF